MDWRDSGFVLTARRHGESAAIVELLTEAHGRRAGLVRGGQSPKRRALLQPGNLVAASWRGRLPEHLGTFEIELLRAHAAGLIDDPDRLAALSSAASLIALALPEHEPHEDVFQGLARLIAALDSTGWPAQYIAWECALLAALGFGLDLTACARRSASGSTSRPAPRPASMTTSPMSRRARGGRCRVPPARLTRTSSCRCLDFYGATCRRRAPTSSPASS
jgi:DNA repair protein RecO (recombination protein O)